MFIFSVLSVMIVKFINRYVFLDDKNYMYLCIDLLLKLWIEIYLLC